MHKHNRDNCISYNYRTNRIDVKRRNKQNRLDYVLSKYIHVLTNLTTYLLWAKPYKKLCSNKKLIFQIRVKTRKKDVQTIFPEW